MVSQFPELEDYGHVKTPPLGVIVAACRLVAVHRTEAIRDTLTDLERAVGDYGDKRFAWELEIVKLPDEPIPAKGAQGLWDWNPNNMENQQG